MAERIHEISNNIKYANEDITVFLNYADLEKYKDVFETSVLRKIDHLKDVQEEDMYKFGKIFQIFLICEHLIICKVYTGTIDRQLIIFFLPFYRSNRV